MRVRRGPERVLVVGMLVVAAACGGGSDSSDGDDSGGFGLDRDDGGDDTENGDGGGDISIGSDLPDYFPSDFYLPDDLTVGGVSRAGDAVSLTGTFEDRDVGDIEAIEADMVAGLEAAGYELLSNEDFPVFVKNGVGRVRVWASEFLDELTLSVDIDIWTDEQIDELRALFAEEVVVSGRATVDVDGVTYDAEGECQLSGASRWFFAEDGSITIQIDEQSDPPYVYADVVTTDGVVFSTEPDADLDYESSDSELSASGDMIELYNDDAGPVSFSAAATCDT